MQVTYKRSNRLRTIMSNNKAPKLEIISPKTLPKEEEPARSRPLGRSGKLRDLL